MGLWTGASFVDPDKVYKKEKHTVYCRSCRYLKTTVGPLDIYRYECLHPDNVDNTDDNWLRPSNYGIASPRKRNKNNDCKDYKGFRKPRC